MNSQCARCGNTLAECGCWRGDTETQSREFAEFARDVMLGYHNAPPPRRRDYSGGGFGRCMMCGAGSVATRAYPRKGLGARICVDLPACRQRELRGGAAYRLLKAR